MTQRTLQILWPAFIMAGCLEGMVFAVVDPHDLHWFGGPPIGWPASAVYTVTFLIFWSVIATAGALTALLNLTEAEINHRDGDARRTVVAPAPGLDAPTGADRP